jgi:acetyl-CoA synthetase (ADP-forming)
MTAPGAGPNQGLATPLSEYASKRLLAEWGVPVTRETLVHTAEEAMAAAQALGFPVALKASGGAFAHKTELGLVELDLRNALEVGQACQRLVQRAPGLDEFLVQEMVAGKRELIAGLIRDPHYGPAVMLGLGGVQAEALDDVVFRVAPLSLEDALDMMDQLRGSRLLGAFRGEPAADRQALARLLVALGEIGLHDPQVAEIDINPLKLCQGQPVAVDALVLRRA